MSTITIEVTQEDIDAGRKGNCYLCPIALAAARVFNLDVSVGASWLSVEASNGAEVAMFKLPQAARTFVTLFDGGHPVAPFTFAVEEEE